MYFFLLCSPCWQWNVLLSCIGQTWRLCCQQRSGTRYWGSISQVCCCYQGVVCPYENLGKLESWYCVWGSSTKWDPSCRNLGKIWLVIRRAWVQKLYATEKIIWNPHWIVHWLDDWVSHLSANLGPYLLIRVYFCLGRIVIILLLPSAYQHYQWHTDKLAGQAPKIEWGAFMLSQVIQMPTSVTK